MKTKFFACLVITVLVLEQGRGDANGDDRFWIGGNANWVDGVGFGAWSPLNDEPDLDDVAIFNTNNNVDLGSNNEVMGLTLSNSIDLSTGTFQLDVNEDISLTGSGTRLTVGGNNLVGLPAIGLFGGDTSIGNGSTLSLGSNEFQMFVGGAASALLNINPGGTFYGNGSLRSVDGSGSVFTMLTNNGTLSVGDVSGLIIIGSTPPARTLTINASDTDARVDLDGFLFSPFPTVVENGVVNVFRNQTLDLNVQLTDAFNGTMNLFQESRLDIEDAWSLGTGGLIDVDNGFIAGTPPFIPNTPAGNATIAGGTLTQTGGTIDVVDSDGTLTFEADFVGNGGTLDNSASGTVVFQGTTTINDAHTYTLGSNAQTVVDGGTTTINDDGLVLDGAGAADWTVTNNGRLNVRSATLNGAGSNVFSGDLVFDTGVVDVNVGGSSWTSNNRIQSDSGGTLIGDRVLVGNDIGPANADIDVNGGTLVIEAPVSLLSDANVNVAAGTTLIINSPDTIVAPVNGANNGVFTGAGDLFIRGAQFDETTTLNFSGGTVGLDGLIGNNSTFPIFTGTAADTDVNADLTINAATFDPYGTTALALFPNPATQSDLNIADTATLTINLDDANGAWTVLSNGIINYNGNATANNFLAGSDIEMNGTLNVNGDGRAQVRMDIGGTININSAGEFLRLNSGGGTHTLGGGLINGPGTLLTDSNDSLSGNGIINANVDFNGNSDLIANGGLLDVNGTITDVHTLRSNGAAAVLDLQNAFNSSTTGNGIQVTGGGRIQGNTITLTDRNLRGDGTVTNRLIVNSSVRAQAGTLILDNTASDYDGAAGTGALVAQSGDLTIRDNSVFGFVGTVQALAGHTVFADGFELQFNSGSTLDLDGGTFLSTATTDFFGAIDAAAGQTSIISTNLSRIQSTANVQVNGSLYIDTDSFFETGVTVTGAGTLINDPAATMETQNNVDLDVFLNNNGTLTPGGSGIGRVDINDYSQGPIGNLEINVNTTNLGDYDRVIISGNAQLEGNIELDKTNADPLVAYDTVQVISTGSGVAGTFDTVTGITGQPTLAANEGLAVTYTANTVDVTRALLGDANLDMTVNVLGDAFTLVGNLGTASGGTWADGDFTGDGAVDVLGDAFILVGNLGASASTGSSTPATSAVPEPGSFSLLALTGLLCSGLRRKTLGSA